MFLDQLFKKALSGVALIFAVAVLLKMSETFAAIDTINLDDSPSQKFTLAGTKVETHIKGGSFKWDPTKISLYLSRQQKNGKKIDGYDLYWELQGKSVFNVNLLEYLYSHQELIPNDWKNKKIVFFWGTTYRDTDTGLWVPGLSWFNNGWGVVHTRFDSYWDESMPTVVLAKT